MPNASHVKAELRKYVDPEKAAFYPTFFKAGPGEYAEGDKFIGVTVPIQRRVAKRSPIHEHRLTALLILVEQYQQDESTHDVIVRCYLDNLNHVNNWDLVDASAHKILGDWLLERPSEQHILDDLAESGHLWRERVSVIACLPFIKRGDFEWILELAEWFLDHDHDLIHKAVGWMLREMGKQDEPVLHGFLEAHAHTMPRTMLRYAIEKLPERQRQQYLARG